MTSIAPLSGWMLDRVVLLLDGARPGFAGHYLRSSYERRQVVAAFLAVTELDAETSGEAAEFLMAADHRSILHLAFGHVPPGFRAALGRSGPQPHDKEYYRQLFDLLSTGARHVIAAILQCPALNPERLNILTNCPADLCDTRILSKLKDRKHAADVALSVGLLHRRGVDRVKIVEALRRTDKVNETIKRWSMLMTFPPGPIPASDGYRPIRSGIELTAIARKYRNCSRGFFASLMSGSHAFGEYHHEGQEVLLSFDRIQGVWITDGVYSYRNLSVHVALSRAAFAFAARHGVPDRKPDNSDKAVSALRRLARYSGDWGV